MEIEPAPVERDEEGEVLLTDGILEWLSQHNACLDWIFAGNPDGVLKLWAKNQVSVREISATTDRLEPEVRRGLLATLQLVVEHGLPLDQALEMHGEVIADWREANAA